jgi:hypothetical protein
VFSSAVSKEGQLRVKVRRTQHEHMPSGLPLKADIARCSWHVANVPESDIASFASGKKGRQLGGPYE